MPAFTTNQWAILALVLILGWFLGWLSFAGGHRWRRAFEQERAARIAADAENDRLGAKLAELEGERERRIEIERERDAVLARARDGGGRVMPTATRRSFVNPDAASIAAAASGNRDDLALIFGVGRPGEIKLNNLGIHRYADIVSMSLADEAELEDRMGLAQGTIADERWRDQAEMLRKGKFDEHARMFA
jgi:predicted flap endonuclease-1-like 5' DNA nuclease